MFDSYGGNTSDYIQVGFKQHRKATATLEAVDDLGDVVDYFVYVGKQIQIKLTSISTAIADVAWRLFDDFNNEIPLVDDNYQDFTKDDIWAGSGKYTIRAEMTDEFGYVIGSAEKTLEGIALGFADATVSPTTMPINQPVTFSPGLDGSSPPLPSPMPMTSTLEEVLLMSILLISAARRSSWERSAWRTCHTTW